MANFDGPPTYSYGDNIVELQEASFKVAAGNRLVIRPGTPHRHIFSLTWLHEIGASDDLTVTRVVNDSMEPCLLEGDRLLLDYKQNDWQKGSVFVMGYQGSVLVKRCGEVMDTEIIIHSYNPWYPEHTVPLHEVKCYGKVLWMWRGLL